ncbi:MAG TPA: LysR substrate-binding domain-containing protein [Beijerinckiaceae bacterium]|nr:LysR substrate-binding domain-containing protein [Beijerinckiaceae bacterium]
MSRYLYLNGIKAFEAAARLGSFAAAATELNVTSSAISRMVRLLEERLSTALFKREANRLTLTPAGQAYLAGLTPLFESLVRLSEHVASFGHRRVLTVGVGPTFAIRWLIPRLADFRTVAPDVEVRFATGGIAGPFAEDWTCGIKLAPGGEVGFISERLFEADLTPVCTPALARQVTSVADLREATLLRVAHAPQDWPTWLAAAGRPDLVARGPVFEVYGQALQAAADGVGVALGLRPYIDDDIHAGRLVAPLALTVSKGMSWYLMFREHRRDEPAFKLFRDWLHAKAVKAVD